MSAAFRSPTRPAGRGRVSHLTLAEAQSAIREARSGVPHYEVCFKYRLSPAGLYRLLRGEVSRFADGVRV